MKKLNLIRYLIIVVSSLMFTQCTSDYKTINGIDGVNGLDGLDGINGVNADAALCIECHSDSHRDEIYNAFSLSGHFNGDSWGRGTRANCARCHNNEGYIDLLSGSYVQLNTEGDPNEFLLDEAGEPLVDASGDYIPNPDYNEDYGDPFEHPVTGEQIPSANPDGYDVSSAITCTGCHSNHRSFDFENDGNDYALRNIDPIKLYIDPTVTLDMANAIDPLGRSNTCINCHQPRNSYPVPSGTADVTITSSRFGPHHGPQSTMLEGIMGANIAGSTGYPGRGTAVHKTGASCTSCHMGETTDGTDGSHTWEPALNTCVQCHTTMTSIPDVENNEGISGWSDYYVLHDLLVAKGYISESGRVQGNNGGNASSSNPLVVPVAEAQAIWNYKTLEEDQSNGIHNPDYARALLKNSLEVLQ